jgi:3-dehydroquinate synthase
MIELTVGLDERSYPILIGRDCLLQAGAHLREKHFGNRYILIADDNVAELYGDGFLKSLREAGLEVELLVFPAGEASKSLEMVGRLASKLARSGYDRKDCIIAFGGGVTGDLAGFLAASYMRGIAFVQIPTTLLAQVDSSVGGKTGVDIPEGKNLLGAFYQPKAVYIDTSLLVTLPPDELRGGLAEVIKYGVIRDREFFDFLNNEKEKILALDHEAVVKTVHHCCKIKADVVAEDERESGIRRILNYGHTIGHAVEASSDYSLIHGYAVAIGMVAAARIGVLNGLLGATERDEIIAVLQGYRLPTEVPAALDRERIKRYLLADKKVEEGSVHYIIPTRIGETVFTNEVSEQQVDEVIGA